MRRGCLVTRRLSTCAATRTLCRVSIRRHAARSCKPTCAGSGPETGQLSRQLPRAPGRAGTVLQRPAHDAGPLAERGLGHDRQDHRRRLRAARRRQRRPGPAPSSTAATGPPAGTSRPASGCRATGATTGTTKRSRSRPSTARSARSRWPRRRVYGVKQGNPSPRRYRALNLLEELDQPGEYYIDRATALLYFWPPAGLATARASCSPR